MFNRSPCSRHLCTAIVTGSKVDTANKQIVWVLAKSKLTKYKDGSTPLSRMYGEVDTETAPVANNNGAPANTPVDDTAQGSYTPVGNAACVAGAAAGGGTTGGTSGGAFGAGLIPLALTLLYRRRKRKDI